MKTIEVSISIPSNRNNPGEVVEVLAQLIEEGMSECGLDHQTTLADKLGFGGNTLTIESAGQVEEICL